MLSPRIPALSLSALLLAASAVSATAEKVGEEVRLEVRSPAVQAGAEAGGPVWTHRIFHKGASYIAPRFERFDLPPGASLVVRTPDWKRSRTYTGQGKGNLGVKTGFWGMHMPGDTAVVEIYSAAEIAEGAVRLGGYAHGYPAKPRPEAICGVDDSQWAKCSQGSEPEIYERSRAVARLLIQGFTGCTGWLVGDAGHLLTNAHCITSASDAENTDYELMAEGAACGTDCIGFGACPGTIAADTGTLVKSNIGLDYALIQLPVNPAPDYGFLQLRETGPELEERIYIPGHPGAWGKRIADLSTDPTDGSGRCEIFSLSEEPCTGGPADDVGYFCDTQGGSSGSPVVGYTDHLVVALHHCANCPNRGASIQNVVADLGASLPPNALGSTCTRPAAPTLTATEDPDGILLSWTPVAGAVEYRLYRSNSPGGPYTPLATTAGTSHLDGGLRCGKTFYYAVRAWDGCLSFPSAEASSTTGACPFCAQALLYENGFEAGTGLADWAVGSFVPGAPNEWRGIQACTAKTGSKIFRFGGETCEGFYGTDEFTHAQPQGGLGFAIPAEAVSSRLSFAHRWSFEPNYDGGSLMISVDGAPFTEIPATALSGTSYNDVTSFACAPSGAGGMPVFSRSQSSFVTTEVDLDEACGGAGCSGHTVRVAFSTILDCSVESTGWFLDDVAVSTCVPDDPEPLSFHTLPPCRLVDTRDADAPALQAGSQRTFTLAGKCGIPATAKALALNLTVVNPGANGNLVLYPADKLLPLASTINFGPVRTRSNNAVLGLSADGALRVKTNGGPAHFVLDVSGWFEPEPQPE